MRHRSGGGSGGGTPGTLRLRRLPAVARLNILLELTAPYVKVGGAVLAMKGSAAREELAECTSAIRKLGLQLESVKEFSVDGASHAVIVLRKIAPTPKQYPRRYAKIKQSPL